MLLTKPAKKVTGAVARSLEERIRLRAYELYVDHGNQSGSETDDWLQAEDEISSAEEEKQELD